MKNKMAINTYLSTINRYQKSKIKSKLSKQEQRQNHRYEGILMVAKWEEGLGVG